MIRNFDDTTQELLEQNAEPGSELDQAEVSFDLPDADWWAGLETLTMNYYLYGIRENRDLRTNEPIVHPNGTYIWPDFDNMIINPKITRADWSRCEALKGGQASAL